MPTSLSVNKSFPLPGATTDDLRLSDIGAVKGALIAIDAILAEPGVAGPAGPMGPAGSTSFKSTQPTVINTQVNLTNFNDVITVPVEGAIVGYYTSPENVTIKEIWADLATCIATTIDPLLTLQIYKNGVSIFNPDKELKFFNTTTYNVVYDRTSLATTELLKGDRLTFVVTYSDVTKAPTGLQVTIISEKLRVLFYSVLNEIPFEDANDSHITTYLNSAYGYNGQSLYPGEGTSFNINLGGDPSNWTYDPLTDIEQFRPYSGIIDQRFPTEIRVDGAYKVNDGYGTVNFVGNGLYLAPTTLYAQLIPTDTYVFSPGSHKFDGITSCNAWNRVVQARLRGSETLFEAWYSLNDNRVNKALGFGGYTIFGDNNSEATVELTGTDRHLVTFVRGIVKLDIDYADIDFTKIIVGGVYKRNIDGSGTIYNVVNGVIVEQKAIPTSVYKITAQFDCSSELWLDENLTNMDNVRGAVILNEISVDFNSGLYSTHEGWSQTYSPNDLLINTNDVKFVVYVKTSEGTLPLPENSGYFYDNIPSMFTTPDFVL